MTWPCNCGAGPPAGVRSVRLLVCQCPLVEIHPGARLAVCDPVEEEPQLEGQAAPLFPQRPLLVSTGVSQGRYSSGGLSPGEQVLCPQRPGVGLADPAKPVQNPLHHRGDLPGLEAGMRLGGGTAAIHPRLPPSSHPWAAGLHLSRSAQITPQNHPLQVATTAHLRQAQGQRA